ncbi:hypothetical protein E2C01_087555 [Portunus trituberculatus]|uniref:Uncharacterized protein n=1 Tax=Portunus trituberculatus TaxID=210409 RepID=A0A5B7JJL3_PORTR|nr:hypothetical protein [Portunus trituberculatus]
MVFKLAKIFCLCSKAKGSICSVKDLKLSNNDDSTVVDGDEAGVAESPMITTLEDGPLADSEVEETL